MPCRPRRRSGPRGSCRGARPRPRGWTGRRSCSREMSTRLTGSAAHPEGVSRRTVGHMAPVADALAPYVSSLTAYDVDLGAPGVHRGLPSTTLTFVLPVGEPLDVGWRAVPGSRARRWSTVSGLHAGPAEIHHDGTQVGVQLGLTTTGAQALLGVPAAALAGELVALEEV